MNDDFDSDTGDDDLFSDDINHDVPFHHAGTLMELNDNKAGMADLDKEKISRIIEEASKGSKFYDHKKKQQERIDAKIADLLRKKKAITEEQLKNASAKVGQIVRNLEKSRDLSRTFVHVDMDAFYAAVEMRDDPSLRDKPMAVGGPGMLATSNYLARRFGVRAAMPGFIGQKLCPDLIIVPPNFEKYRAVNAIFSEVFAKYDPNYSAMSLDEAYLDITEFLRLDQNVRKPSDLSHAEEVVSDLREEIFLATQLTASAGIAPNTLLAKVCSDINKPNGQFYLRPERPVVAEFVEKLSVRKACGIGKVTEQMLNALGITTCAEMFEQRALLSLLFSEISALSFLRVSMGLGSTFMGDSDAPAKSVSNERTFKATSDADFLRDQCRRLCEELSEDLVRKQLQAKSVTIKLKTDTFDVKTRVRNLPEATWNADVLCRHVVPMLESEMAPKRAFRLMGVRASNLCEKSANQQSTLDAILKQPSGTERLCPVCSTSLAKLSLALVNAHLDRCLSGSQQDDVQCPICSGFFRRPEIEHHAATCEGAATSTTPSVKSAPIRKRGAAREDGFVPRDECQRKPKKQLTLSAFFDQRKSES
ncbi:unnamed protein product [Notodromas monacha]|uniref:DNA polymerase kappa n=1 Tax=Notodromas monacha TaxID=399045 RepID=A0A7R9BHK2_9CRUS|nr:unnamed protein product [Notodromas monacha]CAG0914051.1 unnamed protein product [Notodromas monacha]